MKNILKHLKRGCHTQKKVYPISEVKLEKDLHEGECLYSDLYSIKYNSDFEILP